MLLIQINNFPFCELFSSACQFGQLASLVIQCPHWNLAGLWIAAWCTACHQHRCTGEALLCHLKCHHVCFYHLSCSRILQCSPGAKLCKTRGVLVSFETLKITTFDQIICFLLNKIFSTVTGKKKDLFASNKYFKSYCWLLWICTVVVGLFAFN